MLRPDSVPTRMRQHLPQRTAWRWVMAFAVVLLAGVGLAGCTATQYYWQSVSGHLQLMAAAKPVAQWIGDARTPEALRDRLALSQRIRGFAVTELGLPDNPSYRRYADLQRRAVVWNVVSAPEFSLTLNTSCFPILGCVGYRGFFSEADARQESAQLKSQGMEVNGYGVPAYSTLGWSNWAGGDPLLNTFITWPEGELARIIFHELAHQQVYVQDDTMFNESFATAVEQLGGKRWLAAFGSEKARSDYARFDLRRREFRQLTRATAERLRQLYDLPHASADPAGQRIRKAAIMQEFRDQYGWLRQAWDGYAGYDAWVANANNASFGAQAAYDELVPAFEALFEREGRSWPAFYDAVRRLAASPKAERRRALGVLNKQTLESPGA